MGILGWVGLVGVIVVAVVLLIIVDKIRGPMKSDACGVVNPLLMRRKVNGQWRTLCRDCQGR